MKLILVLLSQVVDTCSSKLLECTHHVIELYLSGDSMAQRLPRVGPLLEPLAKNEVPSYMLDLIYVFPILKQPRMRKH